jgi:hypothetical protein
MQLSVYRTLEAVTMSQTGLKTCWKSGKIVAPPRCMVL